MTDGVVSAVKLGEAQVGCKLLTSKKNTFPPPEKKEAIQIDEVLQSTYR